MIRPKEPAENESKHWPHEDDKTEDEGITIIP